METARVIPRKMTELGRIRIGDLEPNASGKGTHQHKLGHFRLTSPNQSLLQFAANLYGGDVRPWDNEKAPKDEYHRPSQFELYTKTNAMDVYVPTASAINVQFEQWSAAGCQKRCDGEFISYCPLNEKLLGTECNCPSDEIERGELAKSGKACARILRLNVILPDLPGAGVWRLQSKGYNATSELMATLDLLQMAGQEHQIIEAVLRLEERTAKKVGKNGAKNETYKFVVPIIWPKYTPRQLLGAAAAQGRLLMSTPVPAPALQTAQAHIADLCDTQGAGHPSTPLGDTPIFRAASAIIEDIDTLMKAQGTLPSAYWQEVRARMGVGENHHIPPSELEKLLAHLRTRQEHKAATHVTPDAVEVASTLADDDDIPF